ncbi:MAG TPA: SDR family oxidoreductase [Dehalococcoidales bacterium]|nr:SDR family oxidoreductase [Dehalococcoidales bacterium]
MDFKGKTAVVTGSSGGIGKGVAIALAKEGVDIVLASRNVPNMELVKKEIESLGQRAIVVKCDVSKDEDVFKMKDIALEAFGNIDILINNAAVGVRGLLENVKMEDWNFIVNTNLLGYVRNVMAFLPHFMARKSGYIVNVSTIQALGFTAEKLNIPYITTKAGILGLSECLYGYLGPMGVKVSCLVPGAVATEISRNSRFVGTPEQQKEMRQRDEQFSKLPFFMTSEQQAAGLLEGMRREDYIILVPDSRKMLMPQGRDIDTLNAFLKKAILPGAQIFPPRNT